MPNFDRHTQHSMERDRKCLVDLQINSTQLHFCLLFAVAVDIFIARIISLRSCVYVMFTWILFLFICLLLIHCFHPWNETWRDFKRLEIKQRQRHTSPTTNERRQRDGGSEGGREKKWARQKIIPTSDELECNLWIGIYICYKVYCV